MLPRSYFKMRELCFLFCRDCLSAINAVGFFVCLFVYLFFKGLLWAIKTIIAGLQPLLYRKLWSG